MIGLTIAGVYGIYYSFTGGAWGWGVAGMLAAAGGAFAIYDMIRNKEIFEPSSGSYDSDSTDTTEDEAQTNRGVPIVGNKSGTVYEGSNWFTEEKSGRVDDDGIIYTGSNSFTEERWGRVDSDGYIYKGSNSLTEDRVGRIDDDGYIYEGSNMFTENRIGRIDDNGNLYSGSNWFLEEKVGRVD
jgi:hypothetical protein